nr:MAG TPA: collagen triple helix repeat protein [Caudoviricetes sp.]
MVIENAYALEEIKLGRRGENQARKVVFDVLGKWREGYGEGVASLIVQRNGDAQPYPVTVTEEDGALVWRVSSVDTAVAGEGAAELRYTVGDTIVKSQIYKTRVRETLEDGGETPPPAYQSWVDEVLQAAADAETAVSKMPYVDETTGKWFKWDATAGAFADTGVAATGPQGDTGPAGPRGEQGERGIQGERGPVGATGATGETGPKGDKGDVGAQGERGLRGETGNGISGIALKSGTHAPGTSDVYTITLTDGITFDFEVYNGANGAGAGDMLASVYDPQGKRTDVYKYADDGLAKKQGVNDEIQGLRLRGGVLSAGYSGKSVAINPAINGLGFALYRGATVRAFYDSYEMEVGNDTINNLFDGKYGSYVNFVTGVGGSYTWDASKKYPAGAYVRVYRNSRYEWYKATEENIGVNPSTDASGVWINKNAAETGTYASFLDITGVSVSLEFTFPQNVNLRYENGVALYWRASGQNASHVKVEKYDETVGWFAVFDKDVGPDDIITNIYLGQNAPGVTSSVQNKIRFTFRFRDAQKWCCLNQIAFSGIVGGIEGTLLNRGGGTMYGNLSPYTSGGASLGTSSAPWKDVRAQNVYGNVNNTTSTFSQASSRTNIATGEKLSVLFGKIAKWFADLGSLAFKSSVSKSDLAADVQTSLGKADSALQSAPVTSVNSKTGAVSLAKGDVGLGNVANVKQYSANNPPPYPVTSVNGKTGAITVHEVPTVTTADNGKFLRVVNGAWTAVEIANANGGSF